MPLKTARSASRILPFILGILVALILSTIAFSMDLLSPFGVRAESQDTQVIRAVKRTQEVSLLSLSVQGIKSSTKQRTLFGKGIPGTKEQVFLQYLFDAKLGIDGAKVKIAKSREKSYLITVPEFIFIGYDDPTFKVAVEDGGFMGLGPDVDKIEMINEILDSEARAEYLATNQKTLADQTRVFYSSLISGIDPEIELEFRFESDQR